jgi:hypothetical protein
LERHFDDTRSIEYDRNTFIIQATALDIGGKKSFSSMFMSRTNKIERLSLASSSRISNTIIKL